MMLNFFCKFFIEGGTNAGVMKHVGEAVKEHEITFGSEDKVNVIGIATWGIVDRKDSLIAPKVKKLKTIVNYLCQSLSRIQVFLFQRKSAQWLSETYVWLQSDSF